MRQIALLAALALVALGLAIGGRYYLARQTASLPAPEVRIGGPFALVDHNGKAVTEADYKGKFLIVAFGYTFCPDICPTELLTIARGLDLLGKDADRFQPLFITVDPERDTPEKLKEYVALFSPRIVGLSGTPDQIAAAAKAYRAFYAKVNTGGQKDNYLLDHSAVIYVMNPEGRFAVHFSHGVTPEDLAAGLKKIL